MSESSYQKVSRQMVEEYDTALALAARIAQMEGLEPRTEPWAERMSDVYQEERDRLHPAV
jgi:hypothetical protein